MSRKGMAPSCLFFFHSKLDGWVHIVDMFQKVLFMFFLLDDKGVIHMSQPKSGGGGCSEAVPSKCSMYRLATIGLTRDPMATPSTCS